MKTINLATYTQDIDSLKRGDIRRSGGMILGLNDTLYHCNRSTGEFFSADCNGVYLYGDGDIKINGPSSDFFPRSFGPFGISRLTDTFERGFSSTAYFTPGTYFSIMGLSPIKLYTDNLQELEQVKKYLKIVLGVVIRASAFNEACFNGKINLDQWARDNDSDDAFRYLFPDGLSKAHLPVNPQRFSSGPLSLGPVKPLSAAQKPSKLFLFKSR